MRYNTILLQHYIESKIKIHYLAAKLEDENNAFRKLGCYDVTVLTT